MGEQCVWIFWPYGTLEVLSLVTVRHGAPGLERAFGHLVSWEEGLETQLLQGNVVGGPKGGNGRKELQHTAVFRQHHRQERLVRPLPIRNLPGARNLWVG